MASIDGLLLLDKPAGMTSRTALDRALRWFPSGTRIGHTGTLDPLATGLLVVCLGRATRLAEYVQRMAKTYRAGLLLGARSDTDDADGNITPVAGATAPDAAALAACLAGFVGIIAQVPPAFSAAKVTGRRAYDLARTGQEVALQSRPVTIHSLVVLSYVYPHLELEIHCGKGTYIRSLARDLGTRLGCGALVGSLRRTRVGPFAVEDAVTLDASPETVRARLLPVESAVAELPQVRLAGAKVTRLCQGQTIPLGAGQLSPSVPAGAEVLVLDGSERAVVIALFDAARQTLRPGKVLGTSTGK
jgi:tRNA pseudouridine55 synthase